MSSRQEIVSGFYNEYEEDDRLTRSRHGQLEYFTTMHYIHRFANKNSKVLEVGAGTGRYSVALAKEGMDVTAVELVETNLEKLRQNAQGIPNLKALQGDATDLSRFDDNYFDVTLVFGPMYHLYDQVDVHKAIDEAIRVTKPGGAILFAFISVFAIMYANYFQGNWAAGEEENFTKDYKIRHFKEQLFTGYDVIEFEQLFEKKSVTWITTAGVDGLLEPVEDREDFCIKDEDFDAFTKWNLAFAEKRELLGMTNHLLYICQKNRTYPDRDEAERLLKEAEERNPGPWGDHSRTAAHCAEKIAFYSGMDPEKAYVLGLLHDIGRRFGKRHLGHVSDGYSYMMSLGYTDAARICLTHSFNQRKIEAYVGNFDTTEEETELIKTKLQEAELDDYDKLIQLCDSISGAEGVMDIIDRMSDVKRRYGAYDPEKWDANLALKDYFEQKMGKDLYEAVDKEHFRP